MKTYKDYGAPTNTTPGNEGDLYVDMNTGEVYECEGDQTSGNDQGFVTVYAKDITNTKYSWKLKSGGASSWNDLTDKPFGEYEEEYNETAEMTIEWDGVVGDRLTVDASAVLGIDGAVLVHVSDAIVPNKEALVGATMTSMYNGQVVSNTLSAELVNNMAIQDGVFLLGESGFSVSEDNTVVSLYGSELVFPKKGLYFCSAGETLCGLKYTGILTLSGTRTVVQKIDPKYLPEPLAGETSEEYEETVTVTEEMTIEFDGTIGDRHAVAFPGAGDGIYLVHISDAVIPNLDALKVGTITASNGDTEMTMSGSDDASSVDDNGIIMFGDAMLLSIPADDLSALGGDVSGLKKGLYVAYIENRMYISKYSGVLTRDVVTSGTRTVVKKIDEKYLPEPLAYDRSGVVTEETTVTWDGVIGDRAVVPMGDTIKLVYVSDAVIPSVEDARTCKLFMHWESGTEGECTYLPEGINGVPVGDDMLVFGPEAAFMSIPIDNFEMEGIVFPKKGLYFFHKTNGDKVEYTIGYTGNLTFTKTDLKKLDPKFLPDTIAPKELILTSSTEGSTKQFKITVADDGTVSAVEVTA